MSRSKGWKSLVWGTTGAALGIVLLGAAGSGDWRRSARGDEKSDEAAAKKLFREEILPALKQHCYECHSAKSDDVKGNLRVDTREGLRKGGDNGPAVVPGDVEKSFMLKAMSYREDDYKMPPRGKLDDELLEAFQRWVKLGAVDDR